MKQAFCLVDCQIDFIEKNGALYVPGAESIVKNLGKLVKFAEERECPIMFTQDCHIPTDPELKSMGGPFENHCMKDTLGAENIVEVATSPYYAKTFTKQCYDIWNDKLGNPDEVKEWLKLYDVTAVNIAGVVGNICCEAAAIGFRKLGIDVYLFENAIVWMDLDNGIFCKGPDYKELSVKRLKEIGCHFVTCNL